MLSLFRKSAVDVSEDAAGVHCGKRRRLFVLKAPFAGRSSSDAADESSELKFKVSKVKGDGRCLFRCIARGLATISGEELGEEMEVRDADKLKMQACEVIKTEKRTWIEQMGVLEEDVDSYCERMTNSGFYGGEPELYLLSEILRRCIVVYLHNDGDKGRVKLVEYGDDYARNERDRICLLYNGSNHYDLLELVN